MSWTSKFVGYGAMINEIDNLKINIKSNAVYVVGTNVKYSIFVEYGTSRMSSQPYFRPAIRHAERRIPELAQRAGSTDELVKLVALAIERKAAELAPVDTGNLQASIKAERVK